MNKHIDLSKVYESDNLDELRKTYDDWAATYDAQISGDYRYRGHERVIDTIRPRLDDDAAILDAGAGSGMAGEAAAAAGFTVIDAMDLSDGMLDVARRRGVYRDLRTGVLGEPLDYATASYDAVVSSGVFTPGHAPPSSFDELVRIVRPGGLICFTLRHDVTPPGFMEKFETLKQAGLWALLDVCAPFQAMPGGEPEVLHRIWLYRVL